MMKVPCFAKRGSNRRQMCLPLNVFAFHAAQIFEVSRTMFRQKRFQTPRLLFLQMSSIFLSDQGKQSLSHRLPVEKTKNPATWFQCFYREAGWKRALTPSSWTVSWLLGESPNKNPATWFQCYYREQCGKWWLHHNVEQSSLHVYKVM
jgi:hypothetical protein